MNKENRRREEEEPTYTEKYFDDEYEYRHVFLPKRMVERLPRNEKGELRLMTEDEWRDLGVTQSHGWEHYLVHSPEPHILLFRREVNYTSLYGNVPRKQVIKVPGKTLADTNAMVY